MNGINPWLQTHWDWRAAGNFITGGCGSGLLLITAVATLRGGPVTELTLLSLALVLVGLALVWFELGRPWRFLHVFFNPHTSWLTREAIVAMPLLALGLAAASTGWLSLLWIAAIAGIAFLYCQGRILVAAKGIPVWRTPRIMGLILTSGIAEGCGVYLLVIPWLEPETMGEIYPALLTLLLILIGGRLAAWWAYRDSLKDKAPKAALEVIDRSSSIFIAVGHIAPTLAVMLAWLFPEARLVWGVVAGVLAALAGWFIKTVIITRAAFNQGYAVEHSPARGGGKSGPGTKPGWE
ncbi:MAG: hypothetical protein QNI91_16355 [Arenicellales bacterium]|nr:hypothetical protein [Arenicellales bacterium]